MIFRCSSVALPASSPARGRGCFNSPCHPRPSCLFWGISNSSGGELGKQPLALSYEIPLSICVRRASRSALSEGFLFAYIQRPEKLFYISFGTRGSDMSCTLPLQFQREKCRAHRTRSYSIEPAYNPLPTNQAAGHSKR